MAESDRRSATTSLTQQCKLLSECCSCIRPFDWHDLDKLDPQTRLDPPRSVLHLADELLDDVLEKEHAGSSAGLVEGAGYVGA